MPLKNNIALCFAAVFLSALIPACSKITEQISGDQPDYVLLTPQNIETLLPVINLEVNQVEFDEMFANYDTLIEIEGDLFMYRNNIQVIANEEVDIEIKGSHTVKFPIKQLGLTFDETYDNSDRSLLNPLNTLSFHNLDSIKAFRLRNSGNDLYRTNIKDMVYTQLAIDAGLDIDLTYGEQVVVFVNSVFYGLMDLRSEGNTKGVSRLYQTTSDNTDLLKITNPGEITFKSGNESKLQAYVDAIHNQDLAYLEANTDLPNFMDYVIYQSFIANNDWPYNNVRIFSADGAPFRFVMYDLDWCNTLSLEKEPMHFIDPEQENIVTDLFLLFYAQENFKTSFDQRFREIISLPALTPVNFNSRVDYYYSRIRSEMPWMVEKYGTPKSMLDWYREIDILKMHYKKRYDHF